MDDSIQALHMPGLRSIETSNIEELAQFQPGKNRGYTQLGRGQLNARFDEVFLGNAQLFHETLNVGTRIEAVPDPRFVPFGYIAPDSDGYRYCGVDSSPNAFFQATGGAWEVISKKRLNFMGAVFERDYFCSGYEIINGYSVPEEIFCSLQISQTYQQLLKYHLGIKRLLISGCAVPQVNISHNLQNLFSAEALRLTIEMLNRSENFPVPKTKIAMRAKGVKKVIEFIKYFAHELPDMQKLCSVSGLSERSLQYGFKEHLGLTPIQYLRIVRLNGVKSALLRESVYSSSVSKIALSWVFVEFGRFAKDYRGLFQELPSQTLKKIDIYMCLCGT